MTPEKLESLNQMISDINEQKEYINKIIETINYAKEHPEDIKVFIGHKVIEDYDVYIEDYADIKKLLEDKLHEEQKRLEVKLKIFNEA